MNRTFEKLSILTCSFVLCAAISGCEKNTPTPVTPATSSKQPPTTPVDDSKAISEFLNKDRNASAPMAGLPANHPPIDGAMPPPDPAAALPPGHPPIEQAGGMGAPPAADLDAITYAAPRDWVPQTPTSQMRKAQFLLPRAEGDKEDGQMVVFYFGAGQGGAVEANIERWKGMFSTADGKPIDESSVKRESHDVNGMKVTTLDVTGRYADAMSGRPAPAAGEAAPEFRMLSAIVETPQGPWFFKGVGPVATMRAQEQSFKSFVASIKVKP